MAKLAKFQKQTKLRNIVRTYDIRTPVEKMKEQEVGVNGTLYISPKDVSEHLMAGAKDTICIFYLEDGSLLLMEKGLAEERLKDEYGSILEHTRSED